MATSTDGIIKSLCALELCVGAGGLALGAAQAGFDNITVVDIHGPACETLRHNKNSRVDYVRHWEICEDDIRDFDFSIFRDIELLSGGPPCQPFSQGGKRAGRDDTRDMFPHFISALRDCEPKCFLIENVRGLLDRSFFNYFNYIVHQLRYPHVMRAKGEKWTEHNARLEKIYTGNDYRGMHYQVIPKILNAASFGVGQRRDRVFIVGVRSDIGIEYSFPLPTHSREAMLVDQWVTREYWDRHGVARSRIPEIPALLRGVVSRLGKDQPLSPWRTVRDVIHDLPRIAIGHTSHEVLNHFLNPGARTYKGHSGSGLDAPAKTIKAGHHGVPGGENMVRLDDDSVRYFSVRECARLQAFPDDWAFNGSWCSCMKQIGNAVPVTLGEVVAAPLAAALRAKAT